jgi:excisionase family DNA binding protein
MTPPFHIDLTELVEEIAARVRDEVLAELKSDEPTWPEWMAVAQAARYIGASEERVRKLIGRRAIPYYSEGKGCRQFLRRRELDAWMETFRHAPTSGGTK